MTFRPFAALPGFFCLLILFAGCAERGALQEEEAPLPFSHRFELDVGHTTARVQVAVDRQETARGLMGRTDLKPDEGMLFVHRRPMQASFWMKNTPLPLDIGFFSPEGMLLEVYPMFPYDESSVKSRSDRVLISLEMNQGWFSSNQMRPGVASLDLDMLRDALRARGFDPAEFHL